jgi:uncharacterized protein (DUF1330 family)
MKNVLPLAVTLIAGIVIGALGVGVLRAQTAAHPGYVVAEEHVTDPAGFTDYIRRVPATIAAYHGRAIARGLPDVREGAPADGQVVILAFDSLQDANRWYESPEYSKLMPLRQKSATSRIYLVDGLAQ